MAVREHLLEDTAAGGAMQFPVAQAWHVPVRCRFESLVEEHQSFLPGE